MEKYGKAFWLEVAMTVIAMILLIGVTIVEVPVEVMQ
jgi:heme exporter protein D